MKRITTEYTFRTGKIDRPLRLAVASDLHSAPYEDALETFNYDDILPEGARGPQDGILQGAFLRDGLLFLPIGVGTPEHPHELFVSDVSRFGSKRLRWAHFDYTDIIPWEPEDYDIWNDRLVFPCNTDSAGVVYSLPYRKLVRSLTVTQPDSRP